MAKVSLSALRKSFGSVEVIRGIDIEIGDGEFVVFVGPSGCGKSTVLRLIAGLEDITSGTIKIGDRVVNEVPAKDRGIAMVFQSYAIFPHMTVRQNMEFGLTIAGAGREEKDAKVKEAARMMRMEELLERRPAQLSGGQRQRVAIGRAIVRKPEVFLFDEPLSNLDAALRLDMRMEIGKLHKGLGATMIYVTHDQIEAMTLADKIVVLRDGNVEQIGAPMELYHRPANRFVAGFIGSPAMNFFEVTVKAVGKDRITVASDIMDAVSLSTEDLGFEVEKADFTSGAKKAYLGVRPHKMRIGPADKKRRKSGTGVAIEGVVTMVERFGNETSIDVELKNKGRILALVNEDTVFGTGREVVLDFDPKSAHLFVD